MVLYTIYFLLLYLHSHKKEVENEKWFQGISELFL